MSREIKFRGTRITDNEWSFGHFVQDIEWAKSYIYQPIKTGAFIQLARVDVDEKTVEQFTGLLDKNGVEIYEGDIVRYELPSGNDDDSMSEYTEQVVFVQGGFELDSISLCFCGPCEVIGNIHQNPELL